MKKSIYIFLCLFFSICINAQQTTVINNSICPGSTVTIVAPNAGNLIGITYSLNPGALVSSNPTFVIHPSSANSSFTVYLTGVNTQSATVTDLVIYDYSVTPTSTLLVQTLPTTCGNTVTAVSATLSSWSSTPSTLNWNPTPFTISSSSLIATYLTMQNTVSVTATDPLGCMMTATSAITIPQIPTFTITNTSGSNSITCATPVINLMAASNYSYGTLNYFWASNSVTFATNSVNISTPGGYTVIATDPVTNCSSQQIIVITSNTVTPSSTITPTFQNITCNLSSITTLSATASPTLNIEHQFLSPLGGTMSAYSYTALYLPVAPGTYTYCLINTVNGCTTCKEFTVTSNAPFPTFSVVASPGFSLGCSTKSITSITVTNAATTGTLGGAVSYTLLGPPTSTVLPPTGALSTISVYTINIPGTWTVVTRDNANFCESRTTISILQNTFAPNIGVNLPGSTILTCLQPQLVLEGLSTTPNVTYNWKFVPNGNVFSHTVSVNTLSANPTASFVGNYTLFIESQDNLCKSATIVPIYQNTYPPKAKIAPVSNITCLTPSLMLTNISTTGIPPNIGFPNQMPVIGYLWQGPSPQQPGPNMTVYFAYVPGIYTLTAQDLNNGCTSMTTTVVSDGRVYPALMPSPDPFFLNCPGTAAISPVIMGGTADLTYSWAVPATATVLGITNPTLITNAPGYYTLTVTSTITGCASTATYAVFACVGLKDNTADAAVKLFPNPTNGIFTLVSEDLYRSASLEIYNSIGQLVKKQTLSSESTVINLQDQPNGLYILHITRNNLPVQSARLIKN